MKLLQNRPKLHVFMRTTAAFLLITLAEWCCCMVLGAVIAQAVDLALTMQQIAMLGILLCFAVPIGSLSERIVRPWARAYLDRFKAGLTEQAE